MEKLAFVLRARNIETILKVEKTDNLRSEILSAWSDPFQ